MQRVQIQSHSSTAKVSHTKFTCLSKGNKLKVPQIYFGKIICLLKCFIKHADSNELQKCLLIQVVLFFFKQFLVLEVLVFIYLCFMVPMDIFLSSRFFRPNEHCVEKHMLIPQKKNGTLVPPVGLKQYL